MDYLQIFIIAITMPKTKEEIKRSKQYFARLEKIMKRVKKENSPKNTRKFGSNINDNHGLDGSYYLGF